MQLTFAEKERLAFVTGRNYPLFAALADAELQEEHISDAESHIQEAKGSFAEEDFLQELIDQCRAMGQGRVTKAEVLEFAKDLEELQKTIARQSEYGLEELCKAERCLEGGT